MVPTWERIHTQSPSAHAHTVPPYMHTKHDIRRRTETVFSSLFSFPPFLRCLVVLPWSHNELPWLEWVADTQSLYVLRNLFTSLFTFPFLFPFPSLFPSLSPRPLLSVSLHAPSPTQRRIPNWGRRCSCCLLPVTSGYVKISISFSAAPFLHWFLLLSLSLSALKAGLAVYGHGCALVNMYGVRDAGLPIGRLVSRASRPLTRLSVA